MIRSFGDKITEDFYHGLQSKNAKRIPKDISKIALRKLDMIQIAQALQDLAMPPGNRLEALKGELRGYYSIRINDQWRIVFQWIEGAANHVRIADYH